MAGYILDLYPDFACLAGRCPATCCSGWKIMVDAESYQRYRQMENDALRQDIMDNLRRQDDGYRFVNRSNGDCAMLDPDGLCRIQRKTRESMLCNTCRKYPRLSSVAAEGKRQPEPPLIWLSLAASCPVVARYILDGPVSWMYLDDAGHMRPLCRREYQEMVRLTGMGSWEKASAVFAGSRETVFDRFVEIAVDTLDILVQFPGVSYLEDSFDLYEAEQPDFRSFGLFFEQTKQMWDSLLQHYIVYRFPSRYLEFPEENDRHRLRQVQGELLLMRVILSSRYVLRGGLKHSDWQETIQWVYRFCAHGHSMAEQVHQMFLSWEPDQTTLLHPNICMKEE